MNAWEDIRISAIAAVGSLVIRTLGASWRISWEGLGYADAARRHAPNLLYAFWHNRLLPLAFAHRARGVQILTSEHRDGEMIGRTIRHMGYGHVRGSSTRGGARAARRMVAKAREGHDLGITVDGPRGPRYEVKPGPILIAKLGGIALLPVTASSHRRKALASWDAFELPRPFTHVCVAYGAPVVVPPDADETVLEEKRRELEQTLRRITEENDRRVGA